VLFYPVLCYRQVFFQDPNPNPNPSPNTEIAVLKWWPFSFLNKLAFLSLDRLGLVFFFFFFFFFFFAVTFAVARNQSLPPRYRGAYIWSAASKRDRCSIWGMMSAWGCLWWGKGGGCGSGRKQGWLDWEMCVGGGVLHTCIEGASWWYNLLILISVSWSI
jgi:hypothetical protein